MNLKSTILLSLFIGLSSVLVSCSSDTKEEIEENPSKPNIVIIYMDDLGYGDMGAYGATEINTPNMDRLANAGLRFTNGYASSATCTPSRYALLTGTYPWRNKNAHILPGTAPLIIDTAQLTLPKLLKEQGYYTGIVGKWHLGLGDGNTNWNEHISPGPNEVGFDYSYILAATQDRVPTVYIHNGDVDGLDPNDPIEVDYSTNFDGEPTGLDNPELLTMKWHHGHNNSIVNGIPRIGFMKGGASAKWSDVDMADHFLKKAQDYVKSHKEESFFLYYALQQPHVPRTPNPRFVGASGMGPRGDVIVEADWVIGEFIKTLEEEGLLENTLIIFSSDNGPVLNDGYYDNAVEMLGDHTPAGPLRGGKYSLFEAGTRVPFFTYWKGTIQSGVSDALVSQIDLMTSLGRLAGSTKKGEDSENFLNTFLGKSDQGRNELILEATSRLAIRKGDYVMIPPHKGAPKIETVNIEVGNDPNIQLYDLKSDIGQQQNIAEQQPAIVSEMIQDYQRITGKEVDLKMK
ncbi:arylsulfatase [Algoriphagus lutimaris]|uniref:sulfatase family protein n=1 Tax=Algoriphagus lutimaris TaxID=613197 RepID=UPI00196A5576|nr:arylsulfatase [Algoriphagus lutimaris]MBN3518619.1 arylsulfatase [Algoriphagus lutimaris]